MHLLKRGNENEVSPESGCARDMKNGMECDDMEGVVEEWNVVKCNGVFLKVMCMVVVINC